MKNVRRVLLILGCLLLALTLVCGSRAWLAPSGHGPLPLSSSSYLSAVAEPITLVDSMSWDDGGSKTLIFKDARGKEKCICLLDKLNGDQNLILNSISPGRQTPNSERLPVACAQERAFLGLLERWRRDDPEALVTERLIENHDRGVIDDETLYRKLDLSRYTAICILQTLRERNR